MDEAKELSRLLKIKQIVDQSLRDLRYSMDVGNFGTGANIGWICLTQILLIIEEAENG